MSEEAPDNRIADERRAVARGALFGALIGDAAGATLEFLGRPPTARECDHALQLRGGGVWGTAPGQITDDGELTLCLARGLVGADRYDADRVAGQYLAWYASNPFDIGNATRNAFSVSVAHGESAAAKMSSAAARNARSKANGALMRATPLGIWGYRLGRDELRDAAFADTGLSHPNRSCRYATAAYVAALRSLVGAPGDVGRALAAAADQLRGADAAEVAAWFAAALANEDIGYYPEAGFVRYGFTHAFRHLHNRTPYADALHETLRGGGDTDTNACIVGGLVGALHSDTGIPAAMQTALVECDTFEGNPRPEWLTTRNLGELAEALID